MSKTTTQPRVRTKPTPEQKAPPKPSSYAMKAGRGIATGRKPKVFALFEHKTVEDFVDAIIAGNTISNACDMVGMAEATYYRYVNAADALPADESNDTPEEAAIREFRKRIKRALAAAIHRNVMIIQKAASKSWQASAWFLERRHPKEWGRSDKLALGGDMDAPPIMVGQVPEKVLSKTQVFAAMESVLGRIKAKPQQG